MIGKSLSWQFAIFGARESLITSAYPRELLRDALTSFAPLDSLRRNRAVRNTILGAAIL